MSRAKNKMSSSGSEGVTPASVYHSGKQGVPPGTMPTFRGGVIPSVALPESEMGGAAPPTLLAPAM